MYHCEKYTMVKSPPSAAALKLYGIKGLIKPRDIYAKKASPYAAQLTLQNILRTIIPVAKKHRS